jgi:hypothetical protein
MDKENVACSLNHRKDEILLFATTWMKLEVIVLSEITQVQKIAA